MKKLMILTSILVLAAGCASNKNTGAPPPATTVTTYGAPGTTTMTTYGAPGTTVTKEFGITTSVQPNEKGYQGWQMTQFDNR